MKARKEIALDFEVDELTNSIENAITGEVFDTEITMLTDKAQIKKIDWLFDWKSEMKQPLITVYKLTTSNNPNVIHGLISCIDKGDHIFMNLIESAKFNKGKTKQYKGVPGNLVAWCCKISFEKNYQGVVSFIAKTKLIEHYQITLGAKLFGYNRMFINTPESLALVKNYFKNFNYDKS